MPRYFFDVQDGVKTTFDSDGIELADGQHARREAIETLAQIAHEELPADGDHRNLAIHVSDEAHRPIFAVRVDFHVEAEGNGRDA